MVMSCADIKTGPTQLKHGHQALPFMTMQKLMRSTFIAGYDPGDRTFLLHTFDQIPWRLHPRTRGRIHNAAWHRIGSELGGGTVLVQALANVPERMSIEAVQDLVRNSDANILVT